MDETFSSIDFVTQCLIDTKRTAKFQEAIERAVRPGDIVLDSGTGSAILALMAARAGAKKVLAVEYDPFIAKIAALNVERNGYKDVIDIVVGDVRNVHFREGTKFDVVIMEMLTTGMIDEFQVWTINHLHNKGYVGAETRFVPSRQDTHLVPVCADYSNYGFDMRMVRHLWGLDTGLAQMDIKRLAEPVLLSSIPFNTTTPVGFRSERTFEITEAGTLNSVYLSSVTNLIDELEVGDTAALNAPVVFPLESDIQVSQGDSVTVLIDYQFGGGFRNFHAQANLA